MTNKCIEILASVQNGEPVQVQADFVIALCNHHLYLYSRLIDANYVRRPLNPLVPLDTIH